VYKTLVATFDIEDQAAVVDDHNVKETNLLSFLIYQKVKGLSFLNIFHQVTHVKDKVCIVFQFMYLLTTISVLSISKVYITVEYVVVKDVCTSTILTLFAVARLAFNRFLILTRYALLSLVLYTKVDQS
jgi:hypothetical protein